MKYESILTGRPDILTESGETNSAFSDSRFGSGTRAFLLGQHCRTRDINAWRLFRLSRVSCAMYNRSQLAMAFSGNGITKKWLVILVGSEIGQFWPRGKQ